MKNAIRNLLLAACVLFAASFDSCTMGVEYDKRHKLYYNSYGFDCDFGCNGANNVNRWEWLGFFSFLLGVTSCVTVFTIRRRRRFREDLRRSILPGEE